MANTDQYYPYSQYYIFLFLEYLLEYLQTLLLTIFLYEYPVAFLVSFSVLAIPFAYLTFTPLSLELYILGEFVALIFQLILNGLPEILFVSITTILGTWLYHLPVDFLKYFLLPFALPASIVYYLSVVMLPDILFPFLLGSFLYSTTYFLMCTALVFIVDYVLAFLLLIFVLYFDHWPSVKSYWPEHWPRMPESLPSYWPYY